MNEHRYRRGVFLGVLAAACGGLAGCGTFWDDVTSRDFKVEQLFTRPDPLGVIKNDPDGDRRARALRSLREPAEHGGGEREQEVVVTVLTQCAAHDAQALCRLAAIDALRQFRDPRAAKALEDAYYRAGAFPPETATVVRCQALRALGEVGHPAAVDTLVRVLREPPVDGPDTERQQKLDERIAAARALGRFNSHRATHALVDVLRGEQDVGLRVRAHASLQEATGKDLPADATVWAEFLERGDAALPREPGLGDRLLRLVGLQAEAAPSPPPP